MSKHYNMNGGEVTLDLDALREVLTTAFHNLSNKLQDQLRKVNEEISEAYCLGAKGKSHEQYIQLCHANTGRSYMTKTAQDLADTVEALFHVTEAGKRETIKAVTTGKGGDKLTVNVS